MSDTIIVVQSPGAAAAAGGVIKPFTPLIVGVNNGISTASYTTQKGYYTTVGDLVTVWVEIEWAGHSGNGDMSLSGLPFAIATGVNIGAIPIMHNSLSSTTAAGGYVMGYLSAYSGIANGKSIALYNGASNTTLAAVGMDSAARIFTTFSYPKGATPV